MPPLPFGRDSVKCVCVHVCERAEGRFRSKGQPWEGEAALGVISSREGEQAIAVAANGPNAEITERSLLHHSLPNCQLELVVKGPGGESVIQAQGAGDVNCKKRQTLDVSAIPRAGIFANKRATVETAWC